jgi:hypothetical protein
MTNKVYKTAKGKPVDMGALRLQNENVRAVGNMGVNARGDRIDAQGNIIDSAAQQIQRRLQKQTNVTNTPVHTSQQAYNKKQEVDNITDDDVNGPMDDPIVPAQQTPEPAAVVDPDPEPVVNTTPAAVVEPTPEPTNSVEPPADDNSASGLAAAMARAKTVKQELEKTARQNAQAKGVRKI